MMTTAALLAIVMLALTWRCHRQLLRSGGHRVARWLGGVRVPPGTADPDRRRLINVVEEMAIKAHNNYRSFSQKPRGETTSIGASAARSSKS